MGTIFLYEIAGTAMLLLLGVGVVTTWFAPGSWYAECVGWGSLGSKVFTAGWTTWCLLIPALLMSRAGKEDEVLKEQFRDEWEAWAKKTPYRLIPYVY